MVYVISYDLKGVAFDYKPLYDRIKSIGKDCCHSMESLWFVSTDDVIPIEDIVKSLEVHITKNDLLFVCELPKSARKEGKLSCIAWNFVKSNET